ncbi:malate dehydrogenase [Helicobacter sp. MIT 21-1697]|uniref:malate dehydrogenase n=1 Tax=Helicobacter sp. MIT 21-1697 TaxID=2993733 RepID=UPI00224B51C1|nr:malate dehydrogenase [Helicobacter sp. MIT 21-1697]MCX2717654.1 malate dehydrogenase [Helicobacter sp. MIT 21-1697]
MFGKIAIIGGSGNVGSHIAFLGAMRHIAREILLFSNDIPRCKGVGLDISQAAAIFDIPTLIRGCDSYEEMTDSEVVIITAGFPRTPNMTRNDLLLKNAFILREISSNVARVAPQALLIIVSNPLDAMCLVAKHWSGFEKERVIGMAGVLDSARLTYESKAMLGNFNKHIQSFVIGAHSDDMLPLLRYCLCEGKSFTDIFTPQMQEELIRETKGGGAKIVNYYQQGSAYFAPASGVIKILEAIATPNEETLVCSVFTEGEYGIKDIYLGLPIKLGKKGVKHIVELPLNQQEQEMLNISTQGIKQQVEILKDNALLNRES